MQRLVLQREIAQQYVNGGTAEPAIALLEKLLAEYRATLRRAGRRDAARRPGIRLLPRRRAEQLRDRLDADYCIVPLDAGGGAPGSGSAPPRRRGATSAAGRPAGPPDNAPLYRWMLNIAHMQLGRIRDGVPDEWRIDPAEVFASEHDIGRFKEVAARAASSNSAAPAAPSSRTSTTTATST